MSTLTSDRGGNIYMTLKPSPQSHTFLWLCAVLLYFGEYLDFRSTESRLTFSSGALSSGIGSLKYNVCGFFAMQSSADSRSVRILLNSRSSGEQLASLYTWRRRVKLLHRLVRAPYCTALGGRNVTPSALVCRYLSRGWRCWSGRRWPIHLFTKASTGYRSKKINICHVAVGSMPTVLAKSIWNTSLFSRFFK